MRAFLSLVAVLALAVGCQDGKAEPKQDPAPPKAEKAKADPDAIGPLQQAKVKTTQLRIDQVIQALDMYKLQHKQYPSEEQGLKVLVDEKILAKMPKDGWGRELVYTLSEPNALKVTSLGADGKVGGKGPAADISAAE